MRNRKYVLPANPGADSPVVSVPLSNSSIKQEIPWNNPKITQPSSPSTPYFRFTTNVFPNSKKLYDELKLPLGIVVTPAQVSNVPVIDYSENNVTVCASCSSYLSPNVEISPDGRNWICSICRMANPIVNEFCPFNQHPELINPVYDIILSSKHNENSFGPSFLFIVDTSMQALSLGLTSQFIASVKTSIKTLSDNTSIVIMSMSEQLSVYDFSKQEAVVVADVDDPVVPKIKLMEIGDIRDQVDGVFDDILSKSEYGTNNGHCYGSALQIAHEILKGRGGCIVVGCVGFPTVGPHALKNRSIEAISEVTLLKLPSDGSGSFYRDISFKLNRAGISLHIFSAGPEFSDLSTIGVAAGLTGGSCHSYKSFDNVERTQMHNDLFSVINKSYKWDCSLRLMCLNDINIVRPHGNCTIRNNVAAILPILSQDDSIVIEVKVDGVIPMSSAVFQLAMLYTDNDHKRMARIFCFSIPVSSDPQQVLNGIDEAAFMTLIARKTLTSILSNGVATAASTIRKEFAHLVSLGSRFVSSFHLLHSFLCSQMLRNTHPGGVDGRMALIIRMRSINIIDMMLMLYPRFFTFNDNGEVIMLPLVTSSFEYGSVFFVHTHDKIYIWVSSSVPEQILLDGFGVTNFREISNELQLLQTSTSVFLHSLVESCHILSCKYLPVEVIHQGELRESIFLDLLVDDNKSCGEDLSSFVRSFFINTSK